MSQISRVDQVIFMLRKQLTERAKRSSQTAEKKSKTGTSIGTQDEITSFDPLKRARELSISDSADRHQLNRVIIEAILFNELGQGLINDTGFQRVVDLVLESIESDESLNELLNQAFPYVAGKDR